jgi:Na+/H+ antiporter NhaD/arsenite permease-like protein
MHSELAGPNPWMVLPFVLLLGSIALAPLFFSNWWGKHYPKVAFVLAAVTLAYYFFGLHAYERVFHVAHEYLSFIILIGSLFTVSGGIHLNVKGEATPLANLIFLLIGALLANVLGTTGASMLLIRPWIRMNKYRITAHHIVFFIFIVSNVGGCLTPVGDPPLFLGYLKGIPFWWVAEQCWPMWMVAVGFLLICFYIMDLANYERAPKQVRERLAEPQDQWRCQGLKNLAFLAIILGAVFIKRPPFLREALMLGAAIGSYFTTDKHIHHANHFNFHPIREVAILFIGIFATMIPALDWLQVNADRLASPSPAFFYWASGALSSVLDNAPTYLSFISAAFGLFIDPQLVSHVQQVIHQQVDLSSFTAAHAEQIRTTLAALSKYHPSDLAAQNVDGEQIEVAFLLSNAALNQFIVATSLGAVFFGANTYIGNGPNFMVKAIADQQKVHTPGFLAYIFKFTLPFMVPMLALIWLLFLRN